MSGISDKKDLIDIIKDLASKVTVSVLKERNVESISYATVVAVNTDGTYDVQLVGGNTTYKNMLNKSISTPLVVGNNVILRYVQGNIGNGYLFKLCCIVHVADAVDCV